MQETSKMKKGEKERSGERFRMHSRNVSKLSTRKNLCKHLKRRAISWAFENISRVLNLSNSHFSFYLQFVTSSCYETSPTLSNLIDYKQTTSLRV
jgi:hypothetical protein